MEYIIHNGVFEEADKPLFTQSNRSFRYGDGLFETIRVAHNKALWLKDHLDRLRKGMDLLQMEPNPSLKAEYLQGKVSALLDKNRLKNGGRARLTIYRKGEGIATNDETGWVLEVTPLEGHEYTLNEEGLVVDLYSDIRITENSLSGIKSANYLPYLMAAKFARQQGIGDSLLLNEEGDVVEASSSNLFMIQGGAIYTPAVSEGCIEGIMRKKVLEIIQTMGYKVHECSLSPRDLMDADELFLTNAISGIRWVLAYKSKRYFNKVCRKLVERLNESVAASSLMDPQES